MSSLDEYTRSNVILDNVSNSLQDLLLEKEVLTKSMNRLDIVIKKHIDFMDKLLSEIN
jgi:hypothetical protein